MCVCVWLLLFGVFVLRMSYYTFWPLAPGSPQLALPLSCASFGCWAIHLRTHSSVPHTHWLFILQWELQTTGLLCSEDVLRDYKQTMQLPGREIGRKEEKRQYNCLLTLAAALKAQVY